METLKIQGTAILIEDKIQCTTDKKICYTLYFYVHRGSHSLTRSCVISLLNGKPERKIKIL